MERANYLGVGVQIRERLRNLIAEWPTLAILPGRDLAQIAQDDSGRPTLHVVYLRETITPHDRTAVLADADQVWGVVLSLRDLRDGTDAEAQAGQMLTAVKETLQGWQPEKGRHPLVPTTGASVLYQVRGVVRYPLYYSYRVVSRGAART